MRILSRLSLGTTQQIQMYPFKLPATPLDLLLAERDYFKAYENGVFENTDLFKCSFEGFKRTTPVFYGQRPYEA